VTVGARGTVVFLTGLSGAGKSTIAEALAAELRDAGRQVSIVDGDELRRVATHLGFDAASREANVRRGAELAEERARDGDVVIAALMSPTEQSRRLAREIVERSAAFVLVYVHTPVAVAEARDPKGLWARARAGEIKDFVGIDLPYEEPADADLVIDTTGTSVPDAVRLIRAALDATQGAPTSQQIPPAS
jgi:sulfate adenylyltransferase